MLEFLALTAAAGLVLLGLVAVACWRLYRRLRRARVLATARAVVSRGAVLLAAWRPAATLDRTAALCVLRLTRAQRALRLRVADAARTGAHLGDVPAMMPRLQAETDRIRTGLVRLPSAACPLGRDLLAAADRHVATLTDLREAVVTSLVLPPAGSSLAADAEEAARGLRFYAAAHAELAGDAAPAPARIVA